jgi:hypothetical protein
MMGPESRIRIFCGLAYRRMPDDSLKERRLHREMAFFSPLASRLHPQALLPVPRGQTGDLSSRECFFITNVSGLSAEKLLTHQRKKWQSPVQPSDIVAVDRLRNSLQDVFKDFRAKYRA